MNTKPNRFERQATLVPADKLTASTATVVGVGAIGRQVALQLAAIGTPSIHLIDFDSVEPTNITTQGYLDSDLEKPKVTATSEAIAQIDASIHVTSINDRFRAKHDRSDIIFCCVDSIATRAAIWRSVKSTTRFWCDGRMLGETIRILASDSEPTAAHYETTLFAPAEANTGTCTSKSTIYASSIAAGLMIHQFTRWLRGIPIDPDTVFNLLSNELIAQ